MRDEDDRGVERLQLALEPLEALDVEVVRRLVEEQQIRVAAERARERGARQLSPPENVSSGRCRSSSENPSPRTTEAVRSRQA